MAIGAARGEAHAEPVVHVFCRSFVQVSFLCRCRSARSGTASCMCCLRLICIYIYIYIYTHILYKHVCVYIYIHTYVYSLEPDGRRGQRGQHLPDLGHLGQAKADSDNPILYIYIYIYNKLINYFINFRNTITSNLLTITGWAKRRKSSEVAPFSVLCNMWFVRE